MWPLFYLVTSAASVSISESEIFKTSPRILTDIEGEADIKKLKAENVIHLLWKICHVASFEKLLLIFFVDSTLFGSKSVGIHLKTLKTNPLP